MSTEPKTKQYNEITVKTLGQKAVHIEIKIQCQSATLKIGFNQSKSKS